MKKYTRTLITAITFAAISQSAFAASKANELMDVKAYKNDLQTAFNHYQASDYNKALPALEQMAKRGDKKAQYVLGTMYLNAQGTEQDLKKSYAWLKVANEQKSQHWKKPLRLLEDKLPSDFLALATEESEEYIRMYGAKAQKLKCRNTKVLGSKKPTHLCKKQELKPGFYFVADAS